MIQLQYTIQDITANNQLKEVVNTLISVWAKYVDWILTYNWEYKIDQIIRNYVIYCECFVIVNWEEYQQLLTQKQESFTKPYSENWMYYIPHDFTWNFANILTYIDYDGSNVVSNEEYVSIVWTNNPF